MIHDATISEVDYDYLLQATKVIDDSLTAGNQKQVERLFGMKFPVDIEVEFEIGPCEAYMFKWDKSEKNLQEIFYKSLLWQKHHGHEVKPIAVLKSMFDKPLIDTKAIRAEFEKQFGTA